MIETVSNPAFISSNKYSPSADSFIIKFLSVVGCTSTVAGGVDNFDSRLSTPLQIPAHSSRFVRHGVHPRWTGRIFRTGSEIIRNSQQVLRQLALRFHGMGEPVAAGTPRWELNNIIRYGLHFLNSSHASQPCTKGCGNVLPQKCPNFSAAEVIR